MFAQPVSGLAAGGMPTPVSRGSSLTPLDGLRSLPMASEGSFSGASGGSMGGMPPGARGRTSSANSRQSPLASTARASTAMTTNLGITTVVATNLSEADNIKVAVRVRPLFPHETDKGGTSVVQVNSNTTVKVVVPGPAGTSMQRDFGFHACLGPEVGQSDVLHLCGVPQLLDAALAGYNVTIFAYGQTGSGKTYTMSGREEVIRDDSYSGDQTHDGIMSRAIAHLWGAIEAKKADTKYALTASYLEIYNEGIYDLLNLKAKNLPVKWDAQLGFFVPGLKQATCTKMDTMMDVIRTGMKHRHVGSHELNIESSRSHSIMTIFVQSTPVDPNASDFGTPRIGKISFVDLAGSERLKDSKSEGAMLKETTNINKSLFVLGKVIAALAERDSSGTSAHIPYRDSKLTKLLMDSLGGNALALMIACCSPASTAVEETLSTLSYATRAKNIQNRPTVQYDPKEAQIANLRREIDLLRQENTYLREQVRVGGGAVGIDPSPQTPLYTLRQQPPGTAGGDGSSGGAPPNHSHGPWPSLLGGCGGGGSNVGDNGSNGGSINPERGGTASGPSHPVTAALSASPHLPPARLMSPRLGGAPDALRSSVNASGNTHLEPLRMSVEAGGMPSPGGGGGALARRLSSTGPAEDIDLMRRLQDTQSLLSRFSEENGRLAKENDRLRTGRQVLSQEHGEVLDEIETLRSKLIQLESAVLSGSQTPNAAKAALATAMGSGGSFSSHHQGSLALQRGDSPGSSSGGSGRVLLPTSSSVSIGGAGAGGGGGGSNYSPSPMQRQAASSGLASPLPSMGSPAGGGPFGYMSSQQMGPPGSAAGQQGQLWNPGGMGGSGMSSPMGQHGHSHPGMMMPPGSSGGQYHSVQPPGSAMQGMHMVGPPIQMQGGGGGGGYMGSPHTPVQGMQQGPPPGTGGGGGGGGYAAMAGSAAQYQQQHQQPHPPASGSGGSSGAQQQQVNPLAAIANVMTVGGAPGGGNSNAMRTRGKYGSGGGGPPGGGDEIIVADRTKLALLLAEGPVEPAVPMRPVPIKPSEQVYANPAKNHHAQHIQKQMQRGGSNPSSPKASTPTGGYATVPSPFGP